MVEVMTNKTGGELSEFPEKGLVFWPVGTGDSSTVVVDGKLCLQVDLRQVEEGTDDESPYAAVIDELERLLPVVEGEPYLSVFVLTHPDQDHCQGFEDLLERVKIGELWVTPRVFSEYRKDLCDDATVFKDEARRRIDATIENNGEVGSGDRVRIMGYDELLEEEEFEGFPRERLTVPGTSIEELDGHDVSGQFSAFVHAPFKDDSTGDRNDTSVALQVSLFDGTKVGKVLTFGDLYYPTIRKIFDRSEAEDLEWDVMLAAHHCSKSVMYWQGEGDKEEQLKQNLLDDMTGAAGDLGYVVASSEPIPSSDEAGDNPPHAKAKRRYQEIAPNGFLCTHEYPSEDNPSPIVFGFKDDGFDLMDGNGGDGGNGDEKSISGAVAGARGADEPPKEKVGFGNEL